MGKSSHQAPAPQQQFRDASEAHALISPYLAAQFQFRDTGINQACNQLIAVDQSMDTQVLKSGLKVGIAAAAGAVGACTGGLGWVALGSIGLGFGLGSEIVDAMFQGQQAGAGIEDFRTRRLNVLHAMQAEETSQYRKLLNQGDQQAWAQALTDYKNMQQNVALQNLEIDATVDGWMNAVNSEVNGLGGLAGEGQEELNSITTGRLHIDGTVSRGNSGPEVKVASATLDGLENAALRNRYLDRKIADIGLWCQFAFPLNNERGAVAFRATDPDCVIEGGPDFEAGLGRVSVGTSEKGSHRWSDFTDEGARKVKAALASKTLRDVGISEVAAGGMFE